MKILSYIRSHRLFFASILLIIVIGASGAVAYSMIKKQLVANVSEIKADEKKDEIKQPTVNKVNDVANKAETTEPIAPTTQTPELAAPTFKTTQEYAQTYLNLSGSNQACLDAIVNKWPNRFTEDVREANIKALRVYASVCSSGITTQPGRSPIEAFGSNGEFFDSPLANNARNQ